MRYSWALAIVLTLLASTSGAYAGCWACNNKDECDSAAKDEQGWTRCSTTTTCGGPHGLCSTLCDTDGDRCQGKGSTGDCLDPDCWDEPYAQIQIDHRDGFFLARRPQAGLSTGSCGAILSTSRVPRPTRERDPATPNPRAPATVSGLSISSEPASL